MHGERPNEKLQSIESLDNDLRLHCHYMAARNYSDSPIGAPKFVEYMQKE
jgi:hypothetical protein